MRPRIFGQLALHPQVLVVDAGEDSVGLLLGAEEIVSCAFALRTSRSNGRSPAFVLSVVPV